MVTPRLEPDKRQAGPRTPDCLSALSAAVTHRTA